MSKNNKYIVWAEPGGKIKVWDWKKVCAKTEFKTVIKLNYYLAISDDKRYIVICSERIGDSGFEIIIWNLKSRAQVGISKGNPYLIRNIKITSNNKYIIGTIGEKKIAIWDLEQFILNKSQNQSLELAPKVIEKKNQSNKHY